MNPLRAISASLNRTLSADRWATPYMSGIEGGPKYMNLLADDAALSGQWTLATYNNYHNIRNPGSAIKYEINPNFWLMEYIDQLSCLVISKDDMGTSYGSISGTQWRTRYGWLPITKRHVIGCEHALTWASGTWPVNPSQQIPTRIRWRGTDGETVDRIQLHQALGRNIPGHSVYGLSDPRDISVAVLDSDLPDTVYIPRMVPNNKRYRRQTNTTQTWPTFIDKIAFSQEWAPDLDPSTHLGRPSTSHRAMVWLTFRNSHTNNMTYNAYPGDSGTPILTIVDGEVMYWGIVGDQTPLNAFQPIPPSTLMTEEAFINRLIEQADDNAIAMGRMAQRTGYTVAVAPNS